LATLSDVITDALLDLGVLAEGETPNAAQASAGLRATNNLVDQWKSENLLIYTITRATATLTPSATSFTVGTGGAVNIPRPNLQQVERVTYLDNSLATPLEISLGPLMTEAEYEAIPLKSLTAPRPIRAYYNPTYPLGTLIPWPISTGASLLWVVYYQAAVPEFAAISDSVALPPGYKRMLVKNLALEMAPSFQRQVDPLLLQQAATAKGMVMRSNGRPTELYSDFFYGRRYDIRSDTP